MIAVLVLLTMIVACTVAGYYYQQECRGWPKEKPGNRTKPCSFWNCSFWD